LKSKFLFAVGVLIWLLTVSSHAAQTLVWDPSADPAVVGYKVYFSDLTGGSNGLWNAGLRTDLPLSLEPGHSYTFNVTAYNLSGVESDPSTPLLYDAPVPTTSLAVTWDPSAFASIANYTLYYGQLNQSADAKSAGLQTSMVLSNIVGGASYFLYVVGRDSSSNQVDSWQQVTVSIAATGTNSVHIPRLNQPPQVTLISPAPLASYTLPAAVSLSANASDPDGTISAVDFYVGSTRVASATSVPYTAAWTGSTAGTYQIKALARDAQGAAAWSAAAQVTLRDPAPASPANLVATPTEDAVGLAWMDTSTNELGFRIYRSSGSGYAQIAQVAANSTTYFDSGLNPGTAYYYLLAAYNNSGESGAAQVSATTLAILPPPPGSIAAKGVSGGIDVSWSLSEGATQYQLQRSLSLTGPFAAIVTTVSSYYLDTNVVAGTTYYYRVLAEASGHTSAPSPIAAAVAPDSPPAAPSNLKASAVSKTQINLTWRDNSTNETNFVVERSSDGIAFTPIATLASNITSYGDGAVAPRRRYYYRVKAQNAAGGSYSPVLATKTR
jgi:fibronectin type 3 domain-containing protein